LFPEGDMTLYSYAREHFESLIIDVPYDEKLRYIVNHTKNEYADKQKARIGWGELKIHPLPLLTSSGNGRGGGDFRDENPYVGVWAGDVISMEYHVPDGFKEILPDFIEE